MSPSRRKKHRRKKPERPFCWYCMRKFVDERVLIMHQKARHFKCVRCLKKLGSVSGLVVHVFQMHKEKMSKVPNAKPNHESIHYDIYGMDGVPIEAIIAYRDQHIGKSQKSAKRTQESVSAAPPKASQVDLIAQGVVLVFSDPNYSQEELRARWMAAKRAEQASGSVKTAITT